MAGKEVCVSHLAPPTGGAVFSSAPPTFASFALFKRKGGLSTSEAPYRVLEAQRCLGYAYYCFVYRN